MTTQPAGLGNEDRTPLRVRLLESDLPKMVCSGQLSKSTHFTLRIDGVFGEREANALMHLLGTQMEILKEET